jgi:hypothetical protein
LKSTSQQMLQLGELMARCDIARMMDGDANAEAVQAGIAAACCVLLPKRQWETFVAQCELDHLRLSRFVELVPKSTTKTSTESSHAG